MNNLDYKYPFERENQSLYQYFLRKWNSVSGSIKSRQDPRKIELAQIDFEGCIVITQIV